MKRRSFLKFLGLAAPAAVVAPAVAKPIKDDGFTRRPGFKPFLDVTITDQTYIDEMEKITKWYANYDVVDVTDINRRPLPYWKND